MIIEDVYKIERATWTRIPEDSVVPSQYGQNPSILFAHITTRIDNIRNSVTNDALKNDKINHL